MTRDELHSAGLLFGEELALGIVEPEALRTPQVQAAVRSAPVPSAVSRSYQRLQSKRGRLTHARWSVEPMMAARRAVLGGAAEGRPKVLVRVDEFPHHKAWDEPGRYGTANAAVFHQIMRDADVPYLMSVTPRISRDPLNPDAGEDAWRPHDGGELDLLAELRRDGVAFGLHGLDHRTRHARPRRHSEFSGLKRRNLETRLDLAQSSLREGALHADVFVPPFNRFDAAAWPAFASRFEVVCGGPESIGTMGFHATPTWRGGAVWLPSYAPLYGTAVEVLPAVRAFAEQGTALWLPVVLHWGWELDREWHALRELGALIGSGSGLARSWDDFLLAVQASRQLGASMDRDGGRR